MQTKLSHNRIWLVLGLILQGYFTYAAILLLRDPKLISAKGLFAGGLFVTASVGLIHLIVRLWSSSWDLTLSDTHLVAVHQFLRTRHDIPWSSVVSVEMAPPSFLAWGAARRFTRIVTADGQRLLIAPHLDRYAELLDQLRTRATNCRVFRPQIVLPAK